MEPTTKKPPGAEDVVAEAEQAVTDDLANDPTCFVTDCMTDRRSGSRLCEGHQDLVVVDPSDDPITVTPMDVQVKRIGRDRLVLIGTPDDEETRPEGYHNCDYMGCGSHHVIGRAVLLRADGDDPNWNRSEAMLRLLDAQVNPWGPEPMVAGDFWLSWKSGPRSAVHFDPDLGTAYVDADNEPDDDADRFWPDMRQAQFKRRWSPITPSVMTNVEPEMTGQLSEQLRARAMTLLARANVLDEETRERPGSR